MNIISLNLNVSEPVFGWDSDVADSQNLALSTFDSTSGLELTPYLRLYYTETSPPVISNENPVPNGTVVPVNQVISFDVTDIPSEVDADSVVITVADTIAWENDAQQNSFLVTKTPIAFGYRYSVTAPTNFPEYTWITVQARADDLGIPSTVNQLWKFRTIDTTDPVITGQIPAPGATDQDATTDIQLDVIDTGAGVDESSVVIKVMGNTVWIGDAQQAPYLVTKSSVPNGFRYLVELPSQTFWISEGTVGVQVLAQDLAATPLSLDTSYSFDTGFLDSEEPTLPIALRDPLPNETDVPSEQPISFSLRDNVQVDLTAVRVYVRGELVFDGTNFQTHWELSSYVTNSYNGYDFIVQPDTLKSWRHFENVTVRVVAADTTDFFGGGP